MIDPHIVAEVFFELGKRMGTPDDCPPWQLAGFDRSGTTHLFVDGVLSVGHDDDDTHFANRQIRHLERAKLDPQYASRVRGFSYCRPDWCRRGEPCGYMGISTLASLNDHVAKLSPLLVRNQQTRWIISAFSLGASVAILAAFRLIVESPDAVRRLPRLILVAPALYGAPSVSDPELLDLLLGPDSPFGVSVPRLAFDFDDEDGRCLDVRTALKGLLDVGVDVTIIYSSQDEFAPYRRRVDPRICHCQMPQDPKPDARTPIQAHLIAQGTRDNHVLAHYLAKPFLTPSLS